VEPGGEYRIGGALDVHDVSMRSVLIEYCHVVLSQQRLTNPAEVPEISARVQLRVAEAS
jgi:hypothetical protein